MRRHPFASSAPTPELVDQNQQDYATQIARSLNLQSRIPGILDPRIQLGMTVDDLTRPEYWHLRRGTAWLAQNSQAAVAGQRASMQLSTPTTSGMLIVIERITVVNLNAASQAFNYGWKSTEAGVPFTVATKDSRVGFAATPFATWGRMTSAAPALITRGAIALLAPAASTTIELNWVYQAPGPLDQCFGIVNQAVLQSLDAMVEWRERPILDSEIK